MKNILKQLYDGELYPAEQIVPRSKAYKEKRAAAIALERGFRDRLPTDMEQMFTDLMNLRSELESMEAEEACIEGMRIGGRIATAFHVSSTDADECGNSEFEP